MKRAHISRRRFVQMTGAAGVVPLGLASAETLTAEAAIGRIQADLGGEWLPTGLDGFKAGSPSTVVKGIATTAMATLNVLKQAVQANANLVLTYEPTFYSLADGRTPESNPGRGPGGVVAADPVLKA